MTNEDKIEICNDALKIYTQEIDNVEIAIKRIYYKWIPSFDFEMNFLSDIIEINTLKEEYESLSKRFIDDPKFLFFIWWILNIEPWKLISNYVDDMDTFDAIGHTHMLEARQFRNKVIIYKWGVTEDSNKRKRLAERMLLEEVNQFPLNDKVIGPYFQRMLKATLRERN